MRRLSSVFPTVKKSTGILILGVAITVLSGLTETDWSLRKANDGILVYTREIPDSPVKELKAVVILDARLSAVVAVLNDYARYPEWVYRCGMSSTLKKTSDTDLIHYQTLNAPWPVESRDFVLHIRISQNAENTVQLTAAAMPEFIPQVPGHVRIRKMQAGWTLTPLPDGRTSVEYRLLVDPGGYVPAWLVNLTMTEGPFQTMQKLRTRVKLPAYKDASLTYIKEPK